MKLSHMPSSLMCLLGKQILVPLIAPCRVYKLRLAANLDN